MTSIKDQYQQSPLLELKHVRKQYGQGCCHCHQHVQDLEHNFCPVCGTVYALRDINLSLYPGEILGVVGESGSGKSTLMQIAYFDQEATSGQFHIQHPQVQGQNLFEVSKQTKKWVRHQLLGMVYQNPMLGLRMNFSAMANISEKMIAASNRHVGSMRQRSQELLDVVNIPLRRASEPPKNFSGGMQQRVQIAKALSNNPPILLLDEVTTGLDLSVQADVLELIKTIQRDLGISMMVVSHDLAVIRMLADRTVVMHQGKIVEQGLTDQILEDPQAAFTQKLVYSLL
ncbi:ATP-binding cassette domain-containing protein [Vaginisenegalia massiliensis]|uniref:ATP-binding cassette domain-containing protein n=1 Tax=Vaginisenegalia massiliensis TaxID=2058294 RepID=UPI000F5393A8|nr:ATP-binding cassette domain-containing protein [Vaginisenegalia massiliensis]